VAVVKNSKIVVMYKIINQNIFVKDGEYLKEIEEGSDCQIVITDVSRSLVSFKNHQMVWVLNKYLDPIPEELKMYY
jgi:hypothetical protein